MGPSWIPLLLWIIYCELSKRKWKPKAKGPPWNPLSFVLPSGRSYFCSFSSSLPICISILSAWLPRKCAWRKNQRMFTVIRLDREHESAVLNHSAGEETGPWASRARRKTLHCLGELCHIRGALHPLLTVSRRGWDTRGAELLVPAGLRFPDSFTEYWPTVRTQNASDSSYVGIYVFKRSKWRQKRWKSICSDLLCTFDIIR